MFCPRCGNNGTTDQKFCRLCGFELVRVAELLEDPNSTEDTTLILPETRGLMDPNKLKLLGSIVVLSTISIALISIVVAILVSMIKGMMPLLFGCIALTVLIGSFVGFLCLGLSSLSQRLPQSVGKLRSVQDNTTSTLSEPANGQLLIGSVTERTTDLLRDTTHK